MRRRYRPWLKQIEEEVGVIDILVNNAGIIKRIPMLDMTAGAVPSGSGRGSECAFHRF